MAARTSTPDRTAGPRPTSGLRRAGNAALSIFGDLLITVGMVLLAFVVWQLFWTDVTSDADAREVVSSLEQGFDEPTASPAPAMPELGEAFGVVYIPRFGSDYARPLYEGTDRATLKRGVGHYVGTVQPGEVGNFSMAGHRTTYGKPFNRVDELQPGDTVIVRTQDQWVVYRVTSHEIVAPTDTAVILPVPRQPQATPTEALVTLTSCHPEFSARQRYIVHGALEGTYPADADLPPDVWEVA